MRIGILDVGMQFGQIRRLRPLDRLQGRLRMHLQRGHGRLARRQPHPAGRVDEQVVPVAVMPPQGLDIRHEIGLDRRAGGPVQPLPETGQQQPVSAQYPGIAQSFLPPGGNLLHFQAGDAEQLILLAALRRPELGTVTLHPQRAEQEEEQGQERQATSCHGGGELLYSD